MQAAGNRQGPLLVAVDAATLPASLAVLRGEGVLAGRTAPATPRTDAWLYPALDECLDEAGVTLKQVEAYAVTIGPGTFTGIRVGLATCSGLATPEGLPIAGVQTLEALAERGRAPDTAWVLACLDARRDEVYGALFQLDSPPRLPLDPVWGPTVCAPHELIDRVETRLSGEPEDRVRDATADRPSRGAGSGAGRSRVVVSGNGWTLLEPLAPERFVAARPGESIGSTLAAAAGRLAARSWDDRARVWPPAEPFYVRPADARPPVNPLLQGLESR